MRSVTYFLLSFTGEEGYFIQRYNVHLGSHLKGILRDVYLTFKQHTGKWVRNKFLLLIFVTLLDSIIASHFCHCWKLGVWGSCSSVNLSPTLLVIFHVSCWQGGLSLFGVFFCFTMPRLPLTSGSDSWSKTVFFAHQKKNGVNFTVRGPQWLAYSGTRGSVVTFLKEYLTPQKGNQEQDANNLH